MKPCTNGSLDTGVAESLWVLNNDLLEGAEGFGSQGYNGGFEVLEDRNKNDTQQRFEPKVPGRQDLDEF